MPYAEACAAIRAGIADRPNRVIIETMGGYTDPDDMESVIAEGKADLISMARAFIADPQFGKKVYEGRPDDITPACAATSATARRPRSLDRRLLRQPDLELRA